MKCWLAESVDTTYMQGCHVYANFSNPGSLALFEIDKLVTLCKGSTDFSEPEGIAVCSTHSTQQGYDAMVPFIESGRYQVKGATNVLSAVLLYSKMCGNTEV